MGAIQQIGSLLVGGVFGLALAAPPGPMNAIIAEETVVRGWTAGFRAGLGAMTADFCFFLLSWAGLVTLVRQRPTVRGVMVGIGGILMLYFAVDAIRDAKATFGANSGTTGPSRGFSKAFALAITNPYQILFWLTVGIGLLQPGTIDLVSHIPYLGRHISGLILVETGSPALIVGLFGGIVVWIIGFPATLVSARQRVQKLAPIVAGGSAVILGSFGLVFLFDAWRTLS